MKHFYKYFLAISLIFESYASAAEAAEFYPEVETWELDEDCRWKAEELSILDKKYVVSFRHESCEPTIPETVYEGKAYLKGATIKKLQFDVVSGSFSVFEIEDENVSKTISSLIFGPRVHQGICIPKELDSGIWQIDDGLPFDENINEMPCGKYGRNFAGQTVFEVSDNLLIQYNPQGGFGNIDKSSIIIKPVTHD